MFSSHISIKNLLCGFLTKFQKLNLSLALEIYSSSLALVIATYISLLSSSKALLSFTDLKLGKIHSSSQVRNTLFSSSHLLV
jgi:hypothetical protein